MSKKLPLRCYFFEHSTLNNTIKKLSFYLETNRGEKKCGKDEIKNVRDFFYKKIKYDNSRSSGFL